MRTRLTRLALAAGVAVAVSAPLTSSANAFVCPDEVDVVCWAYSTACRYVPEGDKVDPHHLLCESFA